MAKEKSEKTNYDSPWKEMIGNHFKDFMIFFFPKVHDLIDWNKKQKFLDKELEKIVQDAELDKRIADKVVEVSLLDGKDIWILIHVEIQGKYEKHFAKRMFTYNYRLFDKYDKEVISLAVLTDDNKKFRDNKYISKFADFELCFHFPIAKLIDYKWEELEENINIFAIVAMAHLKLLELKKNNENIEIFADWKFQLIMLLVKRGYAPNEIYDLMRFIDWIFVLPKEIEKALKEKLKNTKEALEMATYVTSYERAASQERAQKDILEVLEARFKEVPEKIKQEVYLRDDDEELTLLLKKAATIENLEKFSELLFS